MTYANGMTAPYIQQQYQPQAAGKSNGGPSVFGMMTLGALGGGTVGYLKALRQQKNGNLPDTFAKEVYEKVTKLDSDDNILYKQSNKILKKLDSIKDTDGLKKLFNKNKEAAEALCKSMGSTIEGVVNMISADNLKSTKETIKNHIKASNEMMFRQTKNVIEKCWNKEKKQFVKPDSVNAKIFKIITSTKTNSQWKKALKYGGITAGIMGALTLGYKMLSARNVNVR